MKRLLSFLLFSITAICSNAQVIDGRNYWKIDTRNVQIKFRSAGTSYTDRVITIPSTVRIDGKNYTVSQIGFMAFSGCEELTNVNIPNSVTNIESEAFSDCPKLQYVIIPNGVSVIPEKAFAHCTNLEFVDIPTTVKYIASNAFQYCRKIKELRIPSGCTIGGGALVDCDAKIVRYSDSSSPQISNPQNNQQQGQQTIVVEHQRQSQPMQEWQQCPGCYGSGQCPYFQCGGSGWYYRGDKAVTCSRCHGSGKCTTCAGKGGHYITVYR